MKLKDKRLLICMAAISILTAAAAVIRTVAILTDFNFHTGYFREKTLISVAAVLVITGVLASVIYGFFGRTKTNLLPDFHSASTYIPAGLLALTVIFFMCECIGGKAFGSTASQTFLKILILIFAAASVIYFFLNAYLGRRYSLIRSAFAFAPIILFMALAARLYFDTQAPINAPNKNIDQLAYIAAMLFFTAEARLSLGREKWRAYIAIGLSASVITAYASVPAILSYFIKTVGGFKPTISFSITESLLIFALFVFVTSRSATVAFLKSNEAGKLAAHVSCDTSEEKEEEIASITDENQISIDDILNENAYESESKIAEEVESNAQNQEESERESESESDK